VPGAPGETLGSSNVATTAALLFPNLIFGCSGTIVRLTIAVADNYISEERGESAPKIQIWKENQSLYKSGPEILISNSSCVDLTLNEGILQCTLSEAARVSVQPGDILGLEIPPITVGHNGYKILFKASNEPTAHIFLHHQDEPSTVNQYDLSEADDITSQLPQIIPLVILGNYVYIPHDIVWYAFLLKLISYR
jgi:hypothetical protein